jgi:hypothetical protein
VLQSAAINTSKQLCSRMMALNTGRPMAFRSGMTNKSDLRGAMDAGVPVGVVAGSLTLGQKILAIPKYLDKGGKVFVDSGAFGAYQTKSEMDWSKVLGIYESICMNCENRSNLWVVSPDKIGDQDATLELLGIWRKRIVDLIDDGCNVIVPLQCGSIGGAEMIQKVTDLLGCSNWVAGIPSNKEAMSIEECGTLNHGAFHILGRVQQDEEQISRIEALLLNNQNAVLTSDANWLRSRLKSVSQFTDQEKSRRMGNSLGIGELIDHPRSVGVAMAICADFQWG